VGKPAQLKAGDVIVTHDGAKHWHGATRNGSFGVSLSSRQLLENNLNNLSPVFKRTQVV